MKITTSEAQKKSGMYEKENNTLKGQMQELKTKYTAGESYIRVLSGQIDDLMKVSSEGGK